MSNQERVLELLERWGQLRSRGQPVSAEELCADAPELLDEVRRRLGALQAPAPDPGTQSEGPAYPPISVLAVPTVAHFVDQLRELRLLTAAQLQEVTGSLQTRFTALDELAGELQRRGWLTAYQIKQLWEGRGASLVLGQYVILDALAAGGMGQVYKARHRRLERIDALKVIRSDRLSSAPTVQRFQREARAVARLTHPNIVAVHDAGEDRDTHFLAMEYVEGTDLAHLVKERGPLPVRLACDYMRQAAGGLQHVHERGLVHRDIKPSNLMLTGAVGSGHGGIIKILDLGLARLLQAPEDAEAGDALTAEGMVMGTVDFLAPEQALDARAVDIRADLYGLGCTFYFLLAGRVPFPGGSVAEKIHKHQKVKPQPLEALRPEVPGEVAAVVRKLMAKRPQDRYQTPVELAAALAPFTSPEAHSTPVSSFETANDLIPSTTTEWRRKARKLRLRLLVGSLGVMLLAGLGLAIYMVFRSAGPDTQTPPPPAGGLLIDAGKPWQDTGVDVEAGTSINVFVRGRWQKKGRVACSANGMETASRDRNVLPDAPAMSLIGRIGDTEPAVSLGSSQTLWPKHSGRLFVQANDLDLDDNTGTLQLEIDGGTPTGVAADVPAPMRVQAADASIKTLLSREADGQTDRNALRKEVVSFREKYPDMPQAVRAAELLSRLPSPLDLLDPAMISPYELKVAGGGDPAKAPPGLVAILGDSRLRHWMQVSSVAFHPQGNLVASASYDGTVKLWDVANGKELATLAELMRVDSVAFSPNGALLAFGRTDGIVKLWDTAARKVTGTLTGHRAMVNCVCFSPDGKTLASGAGFWWRENTKQEVKIWDVTAGKELQSLAGHTGTVSSVAFSRDGRVLASGSHDGTVILWDTASWKPSRTLIGNRIPIYSLAFQPGGQMLAFASDDHTVRFVEVTTGKQLKTVDGHQARVLSVAFHPDGKTLASASTDATLKLWDVESGKELQTFSGHGSWVSSIAFSPDGKTLVSGSHDHTVKLWNSKTGETMLNSRGHDGRVACVAFGPNSQVLASAGMTDRMVKLWNTATGESIGTSRGDKSGYSSLAFSVDGQKLVAGGFDPKEAFGGPQNPDVMLWDIGTGKQSHLQNGHTARVTSVGVSPDGRLVCTGSWDHQVKLWDAATVNEVRTLPGHKTWVNSVAFSPHGTVLASGGGNRFSPSTLTEIKLWDVATGNMLHDFGGLKAFIHALAFRPGGKILATGGEDQTVRLWDVASGKELNSLPPQSAAVSCVAFSADDRMLASGSFDGLFRLWDVRKNAELKTIRILPPGVITGHFSFNFGLSADGRYVTTANGNGTIYIIRLAAPPQPVRPEDVLPVPIDDTNHWQDTGVDVEADKPVTVFARGQWRKQGQAACSADGLATAPKDRTLLPEAPAMCLLGPLDNDESVFVLGTHHTFWPKHSGRLFVQANDLDLHANSGSLQLEIHGGIRTKTPAWTGPTKLQAAEASLKSLLAREADSQADRERLRQDAIQLRRQYPGTPQAIRAAELLSRLPSPLDQLDPAKILPYELKVAGGGDAAKAPPGLVAILGDSRLKHWHLVSSVAFRADGQVLVSGGADSTIKLWDPSTGKQLRELINYHGHVHAVAFSEDFKTLVSGSSDGIVKIWDSVTEKALHALKGHQGRVYSVAMRLRHGGWGWDREALGADFWKGIAHLKRETGSRPFGCI